MSSNDMGNLNDFLDQIICLTIAPAFFTGGVYYLLAKLVVIYGEKYSLLKPMQYSIIFITCDVISLVVQAIGGTMAATALKKESEHCCWYSYHGCWYCIPSTFNGDILVLFWMVHVSSMADSKS